MSESNESPAEGTSADAERADGRALVKRLSRGVDLLDAAEILYQLGHRDLSREVAAVGSGLIAAAPGKVVLEATVDEPVSDERALNRAIDRLSPVPMKREATA